MADPSRKEPSSPQKDSGSGSEGRCREHTVIRGIGNHGGSVPSPTPTPPVTQPPASHPPTAQDGLRGGRPMKKKAKMGKEAAVGMKVVMVEEPGKKKKFASLDNLPGRARTCSICRREFPTARALFGHMRSHPERIWRGAHPPPVSPRREEEKRPNAEQTRQTQELTKNLLNIGQMILRTSKFKEKEGFQAGIGSSSGAILSAHGAEVEIGTTKGEEKGVKAIEVVSGRPNGSSSGDSWNQKKKKARKKKKKTGKGLDFTDEDQRKRIHSQIDLNKEAPAEDDEEEEKEEETSGASSD